MQIGPYELERELGRGGMGVVWLGRHIRLRHPVAVKTLTEIEPALLERFQLEARSLAQMRHPGIVGVHEAGVTRGRPWLAMELVEGPSLAERLRTGGPLPVEEAAAIVHDLADAVAEAHRHGILHRDLKPANVLTTPDGRIKLTDFGLARGEENERERLTRTGETLGTPGFMPPEQIERIKSADARADVYGLGAVLYALLTGRPPFTGSTPINVLHAVLNQAPTPPRELRPEVPADLEAICLRCLQKRPGDRFASAEAVVEALGTWIDRPPPTAKRTGLLLGLFASVALVGGALAVALAGADPSPAATPPRASTPPPAAGFASAAPTAAAPPTDPRPTVEALFREAHRLAEQDLPEAALRLLNRVLARRPRHVDALVARAEVRELLERSPCGAVNDAYDAGRAALTRASPWWNRRHEVLIEKIFGLLIQHERGDLLMALLRDPHARPKDEADRALLADLVEEAMVHQARAPIDLLRRRYPALGPKPSPEAIDEFAGRDDPAQSRVGLWWRSLRARQNFRFAAAIVDANSLVHAFPHVPDGYDLRGRALWETGRRDEAIVDLQRAIRLERARRGEHAAEWDATLADWLLRAQRPNEAIAAADRALKGKVALPYRPHSARGFALLGLGRPSKAIVELETALKLLPPSSAKERAPFLVGIARAQLALGKTKLALRTYDRAARIDPEHVFVKSQRARFEAARR